MNRTVVGLAGVDGDPGDLVVQLKEPHEWGADIPCRLSVARDLFDPRPVSMVGQVQKVGQTLYAALGRHAVIGRRLQALAEAFGLPGHELPHRLDIQMINGDGGLPWEALSAPGFDPFCLDGRFELLRSVEPRRPQCPVIMDNEPVRLTAVLAANGLAGTEEEFRYEIDALLGPLGRQQVAVNLQLIVAGRRSFQVALAAEVADRPHVVESVVQPVPESPRALAELLRSHHPGGPNILLLYCHGTVSDQEGPVLLFAHLGDILGESQPSLRITPQHLFGGVSGLPQTWIVILSSCLSAGSTINAAPLAHSLVRDAGVPFVVGYRTPVTAADAHLVTRSLLEDISATLAAGVVHNNGRPFLPRLVSARQRMCDTEGRTMQHVANDDPRWTSPVLYSQSDPVSWATAGEMPLAVSDAVVGDVLATVGARVPAPVADLHRGVVDRTSPTDANARQGGRSVTGRLRRFSPTAEAILGTVQSATRGATSAARRDANAAARRILATRRFQRRVVESETGPAPASVEPFFVPEPDLRSHEEESIVSAILEELREELSQTREPSASGSEQTASGHAIGALEEHAEEAVTREREGFA